MLTDDRFAGGLLGGGLSIQDAVEEVLFENTPLQNFCASYPRQPQLIEDTWLPAHQPVLISMAACNLDPAITATDTSETDRWGNRSHLSWGVGAHACPARHIAGIIVHRAIAQLLDTLADLRLAVDARELVWRPGPFHRALNTLPVRFPACPPMPVAMPPQTALRRKL
jgi:cytochrome P450